MSNPITKTVITAGVAAGVGMATFVADEDLQQHIVDTGQSYVAIADVSSTASITIVVDQITGAEFDTAIAVSPFDVEDISST
jgi:hypothetical protein